MWLGLVLACSGGAEKMGSLEIISDGGLYAVTLSTDPDPPVAGDVVLTLEAPETTAVALDATMPSMDMGLTEAPVSETLGPGLYSVPVTFSMSGEWLVTLDLEGDAGADSASVALEVY